MFDQDEAADLAQKAFYADLLEIIDRHKEDVTIAGALTCLTATMGMLFNAMKQAGGQNVDEYMEQIFEGVRRMVNVLGMLPDDMFAPLGEKGGGDKQTN
jgi:hypothetical protein